MLNEKLDWSTDSLAAAWAANGAVIMKHGTSIKEDLSRRGNGWQLCSDEDCSTHDACRIDEEIISGISQHCAPYGWADESGQSRNSHGAVMVMEQKYMEMASDNGDQSLAAGPTSSGKTMYRPRQDLLCYADNSQSQGYWHACDKTGCACVGDYSCGNSEDGVWEFCRYGCDPETGKCKSGEPVKECELSPLGRGDSAGPFENSCGISITITDLSEGRNAITGSVTYNNGGKDPWIVECDGSEQEVTREGAGDVEKICYVTCDGFFLTMVC